MYKISWMAGVGWTAFAPIYHGSCGSEMLAPEGLRKGLRQEGKRVSLRGPACLAYPCSRLESLVKPVAFGPFLTPRFWPSLGQEHHRVLWLPDGDR